MDEAKTLNHSKWKCKYHVVFIPKYRRKSLYKELRGDLGQVFRELARRKGCEIEEGHVMPDHIHMMISIPPKYAVSQVIRSYPDSVCPSLPEIVPVWKNRAWGQGRRWSCF